MSLDVGSTPNCLASLIFTFSSISSLMIPGGRLLVGGQEVQLAALLDVHSW